MASFQTKEPDAPLASIAEETTAPMCVAPVEEPPWTPASGRDTSHDAELFSYVDEPGLSHPEGPNPGGAGVVTTHDAHQRAKYLEKNKELSRQTVEKVEEAARRGDQAAAEAAAREGVEARNAGRTAAQDKLSPGGRQTSKALDKGWDWKKILEKYRGKADPGDAFDLPRQIGKGVGRSNPMMSWLAKWGRRLGPWGMILGAGSSIEHIAEAPPEEQPRVASQEAGSWIGGAMGLTVGTAAAAMALAPLGIPAALLVGGTLLGGGALSILASLAGHDVGGLLYDGLTGRDKTR